MKNTNNNSTKNTNNNNNVKNTQNSKNCGGKCSGSTKDCK